MTTMTQPNTMERTSRPGADTENDEAAIRALIAGWSRALEAKDVDGLTADYLPGAVLYDVKPPHKVVGPAAIRALWAACLPYFPAAFRSEHRDLSVAVGGDVAFCHGLHHIRPLDDPDHPAGRSWMRVTACYRKVGGRWKVAHEHVSMPFDCATGQVAPITNPDAA
jgi:ketosteroid isomerase-like protein